MTGSWDIPVLFPPGRRGASWSLASFSLLPTCGFPPLRVFLLALLEEGLGGGKAYFAQGIDYFAVLRGEEPIPVRLLLVFPGL